MKRGQGGEVDWQRVVERRKPARLNHEEGRQWEQPQEETEHRGFHSGVRVSASQPPARSFLRRIFTAITAIRARTPRPVHPATMPRHSLSVGDWSMEYPAALLRLHLMTETPRPSPTMVMLGAFTRTCSRYTPAFTRMTSPACARLTAS